MTKDSETGSEKLLDQNDTWSNAEDWVSDSENDIICPFCPNNFPGNIIFIHLKSVHSVDLFHIKNHLALDFFSSIRLINYVRANSERLAGNTDIANTIITECPKWSTDDSYLIPHIQDDALLYVFGDSEKEEYENQQELKVSDDNEMLIAELTRQLEETTAALSDTRRDFFQYKQLVQKTFMDPRNNERDPTMVPENNTKEKDYYFESYAVNDIHETMLRDIVRTDAYRDFTYENKHFFANKVVLDVGCGTGILSMFAAKAGAKAVYSVDNSLILEKAKLIVKENGLDKVITFFNEKIENVVLPVEKVDIIISEWMGYFLLFEGMLDSVLYARDKWLSPSGVMAPSRTDIIIAAVGDEEWYNDKINFWNNVYGFSMNAMNQNVKSEGIVTVIRKEGLISKAATIKKIDTKTVQVGALEFEEKFELDIERDGKVFGFCGWFDTYFGGDKQINPIFFSTSPSNTPTHWMQTVFVLNTPVLVKQNDKVLVTLKCTKSKSNPRELDVVIEYRVSPDGPISCQIFAVV